MRRDRAPQAGPPRLLQRRPDRIENAASWLLTGIGLLVVVLAIATGARLYEQGIQRNTVEAGDRTRAEAVLLEPSPADTPVAGTSQPGRSVPAPVPARYTTSDGVEHIADVWVLGPRAAGTPVSIWVNRAGAVTTEPSPRADALRDATIGVIAIVVPGALILGGIWALMHIGVRRANFAHWDREWERVESQWRRQPPDPDDRR